MITIKKNSFKKYFGSMEKCINCGSEKLKRIPITRPEDENQDFLSNKNIGSYAYISDDLSYKIIRCQCEKCFNTYDIKCELLK